ncbi:transcriptional regulator [Reticulibacter mediterranei]|uniref:Transcriptional regulator n=1 Tax=Reticulibacter mediterranei TaxID=2778369 RepID=A0A8J3MZG2_9CHLR|nr:TetR/AcrR family transcriptional regulator [Reticulibacter mediterranei]GHO90175.1 transcriptional regulator [Reticulibacter mediterranei]
MPDEPSTPRGRSTRERILAQAAQLVGEKGVRGTSLNDIRATTSVSKSQLYHYFANKENLVQAIIERQTTNVLDAQQPLLTNLDSWENLERWCEALIALQEERQCVGGCPIGSLASELADQDEAARVALVHSFDQWEHYLVEGFTRMREQGDLRPDADPAELAVAVMTSLQGGLLLTQTRKTTQPLRIALHAAFTYVRSFAS